MMNFALYIITSNKSLKLSSFKAELNTSLKKLEAIEVLQTP
jgi:hypothetical protein